MSRATFTLLGLPVLAVVLRAAVASSTRPGESRPAAAFSAARIPAAARRAAAIASCARSRRCSRRAKRIPSQTESTAADGSAAAVPPPPALPARRCAAISADVSRVAGIASFCSRYQRVISASQS